MSWEKSQKKKNLKKEWSNKSYQRKHPPMTAKLLNDKLPDRKKAPSKKNALHSTKTKTLKRSTSISNSRSSITISKSKFYSHTRHSDSEIPVSEATSRIARSREFKINGYENNHNGITESATKTKASNHIVNNKSGHLTGAIISEKHEKNKKVSSKTVSKSVTKIAYRSSSKHKSSISKQSQQHLMEKKISRELDKSRSIISNAKQKDLTIPSSKKEISELINFTSNQENDSAVRAIQLRKKLSRNESVVHDTTKDSSVKENMKKTMVHIAPAECERDAKSAAVKEQLPLKKITEKVNNSKTLISVNKDTSLKNDKYKSISPVIKNSISKTLRNRIKLKSMNANEKQTQVSSKPVDVRDTNTLHLNSDVSSEVYSASKIGASQQRENVVVGCNNNQNQTTSVKSKNACANNSSLKTSKPAEGKPTKSVSKAKKSRKFIDTASVKSKNRILRAKAKILRAAKLQCRMKLLRYHNADASAETSEKVADLKSTIQPLKPKILPKHTAKTNKSDSSTPSVRQESQCSKPTSVKEKHSEKTSVPVKATSKSVDLENSDESVPSDVKKNNSSTIQPSNSAIARQSTPKSSTAKISITTSSSHRTADLKNVHTAKKTFQGSNNNNGNVSSPDLDAETLKKRKRHKYFRGGRYSLSINGVTKKKRRLSEASALPSPNNADKSNSSHAKLSTSTDDSVGSVCSTALSKHFVSDSSLPSTNSFSDQSHRAESCRSTDGASSDQETFLENEGPRQVAKKSFVRSNSIRICEPFQQRLLPIAYSSSYGIVEREIFRMEPHCDSRSFYDLLDYFSHMFRSCPLTPSSFCKRFQIQCSTEESPGATNYIFSNPAHRMKSLTNGGGNWSKKTFRQPIMRNSSQLSSFSLPRISENDFYSHLISGDVAKVIQCLAYKANPNIKFRDENTPLHIAAVLGHRPMVQLLIQAGSYMDMMNYQLKTPLMLAVEKGFFSVVEYLLMAGASVLCKDEAGMLPFHLAAKGGHLNIVKLIYQSKSFDIDIDEQDDGGWTALSWASELGHYEIVRWLLDNGANPDVKDRDLNSALHWAAFAGCGRCVSAILEKDVNVNAVNIAKDTALHIASRKNHYECVLILVSNGAATNLRNHDSLSPLLCCTDYSSEIWKFLQACEIKFLTEGFKTRNTIFVYGDVAKGKEKYPIEVVNEVNQEQFSLDFCYVTEICESPTININRNIKSMNACHCQGICSTGVCSCAMLSFRLCYGKNRCLVPDFDIFHPPVIFECSKICSCDDRCLNRVVQHGIKYHLQLFRTDGKGWGVRSLTSIPKGAFVCQYLGELLTEEEYMRRDDDSYTFELENEDNQSHYIDAKFYGNVSRFLNHSCSPNLTPVKVFTEHQDMQFPRIAFFSIREIKAKEELCFDYGVNFWLLKSRYFLCLCGSQHCKYSPLTINETFREYCSQ